MIKKMGIAFLCIVLGTSLYARDDVSVSTTFIGLEVGYVEVQGDVGFLIDDAAFIQPDFIGDYDVQYGFRIGAQRDKWRTTLIFDYYDSKDNDQNLEQGYLTLDYFILEEASAFRPYIGLNIGYGNYESSYVEDSGFMYGGQVGMVLEVAEKINLDLGFRYTLSGADAFDHVGGVIFGINYLF